jgi:hypothetical protein
MAEEVKSEFASEQVVPELTELQKVQQRIANYQIGINPQSASAVSTLLQLHLKSGLIKIEELDAVIAVRNEIDKGLTDYNNAVQVAQQQLTELQEADRLAKEAQIEADKAALTDKIRDQRKQRKDAELKVAQLEAILASHGINVDLNNDGVIGVKEGQLNQDGFVELSAQEAAQLAKEHGVSIPETKIQKGKQGEPKQTSKAFQMARLLNPDEGVEQSEPSVAEVQPVEEGWDANGSPVADGYVPQSETTVPFTADEELQSKVEETKEAFSEWEEQTETEVADEEMIFGNESTEEDGFDLPLEEEVPTLEIPVPEDAKGIEDFYEEVDRVEEELNDLGVPEGDDSAELKVAEEDVKTQPTYAKPNNVPITKTNVRPLTSGDSVEAPIKEEQKINTYASEEEMLEAVQKKIDDAKVEEEEEFDELVIPSADELRGMTKKKIKETAEGLNFEVSTNDTKEEMIESIAVQTESLIESLQESDEFISATETTKGEEDDDDRRDGGYF